MKTILFTTLLLLTMSCSSSKKDITMDFNTIYSASYGGNEEKGHLIIDDKDDLIKELERLEITEFVPNISEINFNKNNIIILHLGQKSTGGFSIDIDKIELVENELVVYSKIITSKEKYVTMALTNPYCISIIPKVEKYNVK